MLKVVEKKVRTSLPAVYRSKENGALVLFFKPYSGVCLNGVYVFGFHEPSLNCITNAGWERVKVRIKTLPASAGYSFPNVLRSKKGDVTVLFLSLYVAFRLDLEGCGIRALGEDWNYVECINSDDWDAVDMTFK